MKKLLVMAVVTMCCGISFAQRATAQAAPSMVAGGGCWDCTTVHINGGCTTCNPGAGNFWNCMDGNCRWCSASSYGCGVIGRVPIDVDGVSQFVTTRNLLGTTLASVTRRQCDGVIVARNMGIDEITRVRQDTASLRI
jgi:hypothetical protein